METEKHREGIVYLEKFTSRKDKRLQPGLDETSDSLRDWVGRYLELAVVGVRSKTVAEKTALHLGRFVEFFEMAYGHDRVSAVSTTGRASVAAVVGGAGARSFDREQPSGVALGAHDVGGYPGAGAILGGRSGEGDQGVEAAAA